MADPVAAPARLQTYAETPQPDRSTPWREADFCVVDVETTGLDPAVDEIVSFAALHVAGGRLRLEDAHYRLIRPRRMPDPDTVLIHGLRTAELADAPPLAEALDTMLVALTGRVMVAHVASIEREFIGAALRAGGARLTNPMVDTATLGAELLRLRGENLEDALGLTPLARALGLPVHRPHEADGDALTTAQVFLALASHLDRYSPQTVGSLGRLSRRTVGKGPLRQALRRLHGHLPLPGRDT
jgi:DNA polymerase III subunit epsilon